MGSVVLFRRTLIACLVVLTLVLAADLGAHIYDEAHPRDVQVWCDATTDDQGNQAYDRSYEGPADLVLGACQMAAGTNNP